MYAVYIKLYCIFEIILNRIRKTYFSSHLHLFCFIISSISQSRNLHSFLLLLLLYCLQFWKAVLALQPYFITIFFFFFFFYSHWREHKSKCIEREGTTQTLIVYWPLPFCRKLTTEKALLLRVRVLFRYRNPDFLIQFHSFFMNSLQNEM